MPALRVSKFIRKKYSFSGKKQKIISEKNKICKGDSAYTEYSEFIRRNIDVTGAGGEVQKLNFSMT